MPVYLKPNEFHVKDESTGNYLDINAVAEQSTAQTVAAVTAEGTTQIDRINTRATEVSASLPKSGEMEDMVAVPFVQATAYPAGKYVIQEVSGVNHLYYLPNGHEANVTWENTTKVGPLNLGDETTSLKSAIVDLDSAVAPIVEDKTLTFSILGYVKADGTISTATHSERTGFIPVKGYKSVKFVGNAYNSCYAIAFFDKTGTILQSGNVIGNGAGTYNANVPDNAFYVVVSNNGSGDKSAIIYAKDNNLQKQILDLDTKADNTSDKIQSIESVINGGIVNIKPSFTIDGYYSSSTGELNPTSNAKNTGLIFVGSCKKVKTKSNLTSDGLAIAFFDENKDPILSSSVSGNGEGTYTANIPNGAYYVALSAYQYPSATGEIYSDDSLETRVDILEAEQKHYNTFTVIGDSYSSFSGYMADPNALCWYPASQSGHSDNDVENVDQTWWYKFAQLYGCQLVENASWSGSCISYDAYGEGTDDGKDFSFVQRCRTLKSAELIIIYGGTNDAWANVAMGNYKYSGFTESDFETFRPSAAFVIDYILKHNIGSKILFVYNPTDIIGVNVPASLATICEHYGVDYLALPSSLANNLTNSHPNESGMTIIANAIKSKLLGQ